METTKINWLGNKNYNMNCDIEELEKLGFDNCSYHHDLAPSYITKDRKFQVFFIDIESEEMKKEKQDKKFIINRVMTNLGEEVLEHIKSTNSFDDMIETIKSYQ